MCYEWLRAVCFGDLLFLTESNVSQIESKVNGGLSTSLVEPVIQVDTKWCEILRMVDFLTYEVHHRMLGLFIPSTPQNYLKIHMSYSLCHTCGYPRSVSICKYGPFLWCVNSLKCGVVAIYCLRVWIGENADFFFLIIFLPFHLPLCKSPQTSEIECMIYKREPPVEKHWPGTTWMWYHSSQAASHSAW